MIRTETSKSSIGLKKTLVFYSGKAPKGIRTSWIMNEYRLPHHETERYQKAEISLCRVYKRAGVEDHHSSNSLPRSLISNPSKAFSSSSSSRSGSQFDKKQPHLAMEKLQPFGTLMEMEKLSTETDGSSGTEVTTALGLSKHNAYHPMPPAPINSSTSLGVGLLFPPSMEEDQGMFLKHAKQASSFVPPNCANLFSAGASAIASNLPDDLLRLVNHHQAGINHQQPPQQQQQLYAHHHQHLQSSGQFSAMAFTVPQSHLSVPPSLLPTAFSDRPWDWSQIPEANTREFNNPFK
uniref:NAC transcription factors 10 n=1 Tax=Rhizophora mucronata TaxID=61149 RepID=A0A2P2JTJ0_RHIMU